jgi:hypothetical protein
MSVAQHQIGEDEQRVTAQEHEHRTRASAPEEQGRHGQDDATCAMARSRYRARSCRSSLSSGWHGRRQQVLHRAALDLAGERHRRHHHHGHGEDDAEQAGHDVVRGDALRVVAPVNDDSIGGGARARKASGPVEFWSERRLRTFDRGSARCRRRPPDRWRRRRSAAAVARRARRAARSRRESR